MERTCSHGFYPEEGCGICDDTSIAVGGLYELVRAAMNGVEDRVLAQAGLPIDWHDDCARRVDITGADVIKVLNAFEEALAVLRLLRLHRTGADTWDKPIPPDLLDRESGLIGYCSEQDERFDISTTCPDCGTTGQPDQFCRFCQQHFGPNTNRPHPDSKARGEA
jgi:hypothetical protein